MSSSIKRPAAYRLVVADELGVLKGVFPVRLSSQPAPKCTWRLTAVPYMPAVIEVPAGPKWADAAVVQTW